MYYIFLHAKKIFSLSVKGRGKQIRIRTAIYSELPKGWIIVGGEKRKENVEEHGGRN